MRDEDFIQAVILEAWQSMTTFRPCPFLYLFLVVQGRPRFCFQWASAREWWMSVRPGDRLPKCNNHGGHPSWLKGARRNNDSLFVRPLYWHVDLVEASQAGLIIPPIPDDAFETNQERRRRGPHPPPPAQQPFRTVEA